MKTEAVNETDSQPLKFKFDSIERPQMVSSAMI